MMGGVTVALLAAVVLAGVALVYRDQLVRRLTHRKGRPARAVAWTPVPGDEPPALHLAVVGDVGHGGPRVRATGAAVAAVDAAQPLDGLVLLGDNVYPSGDPSRLGDTVFGPFAGVLDHVSLWAVLGNHDVRRGHGPAQAAALGMPGRWWARRRGDVLVIGLDSTVAGDPGQRAWLEATLASATERWRIVVLHHPPFSAGYQGSDQRARRAFAALFERHGVQLVVAGHDHDYQRSVPVGGVTYVVSGGAAGSRRTGEAEFTAVSFSWHHFVELAVFPDRLVVRAVSPGLRVADEAVIPFVPVESPVPPGLGAPGGWYGRPVAYWTANCGPPRS